MIPEQIATFGDLHAKWDAAQTLLAHIMSEGFNIVFNLGDEQTRLYPLEQEKEAMDALFGELRKYVEGDANRTLVCLLGEKIFYIPRNLWKYYVGVDPQTGKISKKIYYQHENILAVHNGGRLLEYPETRELISGWKNYEPLVIFHGHSHSVGVLPYYKWLAENKIVDYIPEGVRKYPLEPRHVYWVNPGSVTRVAANIWVASLAEYDPNQQVITLRSIHYQSVFGQLPEDIGSQSRAVQYYPDEKDEW